MATTKSLLNGHSALIVKVIVGLALAAVSTAIGFHQGQITQLWRAVDHKVDINESPQPLYRDYVESRLEAIIDRVRQNAELLKEMDRKLDRHMLNHDKQ